MEFDSNRRATINTKLINEICDASPIIEEVLFKKRENGALLVDVPVMRSRLSRAIGMHYPNVIDTTPRGYGTKELKRHGLYDNYFIFYSYVQQNLEELENKIVMNRL